MNLERSIKREKRVIAEINKGNIKNLQELLKLARDFNDYYQKEQDKNKVY